MPLGERAFRAPLPEGADPAAVLARLRAWPGVIDAVVTDGWAAIYGAPRELPPLDATAAPVVGREHVVPVVLDGADLDEVGRASGLSPDELRAAIVAPLYQVLFVGFLPGFGYLGGLDRRIVAPRRPTPRPRVAAGSLAVAGRYAGIYPTTSPGGWNLVGRTAERPPLAAGDRVRLVRT